MPTPRWRTSFWVSIFFRFPAGDGLSPCGVGEPSVHWGLSLAACPPHSSSSSAPSLSEIPARTSVVSRAHRLLGVLSLLRLRYDAGTSALGSARGTHSFSSLGCVFPRLPPPSFDSPNFCTTPHYFAVTTFPFLISTHPTFHFSTQPTIPQILPSTVNHTSNCPSHTPVATPSSAVALPGATHGSDGSVATLGRVAPMTCVFPLDFISFHPNFYGPTQSTTPLLLISSSHPNPPRKSHDPAAIITAVPSAIDAPPGGEAAVRGHAIGFLTATHLGCARPPLVLFCWVAISPPPSIYPRIFFLF